MISMKSRIRINPNAAQPIRDEAAKRILRAAVYFVSLHKQKLGVSNPRPYETPSRPGEYPRKRTGWLQAHVAWEPTQVADIIAGGYSVRAGYVRNASYGIVLELFRGRLGLDETVRRHRQQLAALIGDQA